MTRQMVPVIFVAVMAAIIVGVDVAFLRGRFWERLIVNIGIVLVAASFYWRFFRGHEGPPRPELPHPELVEGRRVRID